MTSTLEFKWTVSRARDTYGYNVMTLYVDGEKTARCNGGGYDMKGTVLGSFIAHTFRDELLKLNTEFYGLTFHDPDYDPGQRVIEGGTIEKREEAGKSLGLERYQSFYAESSKTPTPKHIIPSIDGACGFSSVERILKAIGYCLEYVPTRGKTEAYTLEKKE